VQEVLTAIVTSLIASVVFYIVFQYIPERLKYRKIRPRIEVELTEIASSLYFYLNYAFDYNAYRSAPYDEDFNTESLSERDFKIGLGNKCLNESYLFDENKDKLVVIGDKLKKSANEVSKKIWQVLLNQHFLTADEILIIEDIDRLLFTHLYDSKASDQIGIFVLRPVNPSISYMCHNFYKLYQLWTELRHVMFEFTFIKKEHRQGLEKYFNLNWSYLKLLVANKEYKKAKKKMKMLSRGKITDFQKEVLNSFELRMNLDAGNLSRAKMILKKMLTDFSRDNLVYMRGFLSCVIDNEEMMKLCSSLCPAEEINEWLCCVEREKKLKAAFVRQNQMLIDYYENKERNQPRLG
jgi:hypothetical protein